MPKTWPPATRQRALEIAQTDGAAAASVATGVPAATIRYWRRQLGLAGPPSGADVVEWAAVKEAGAAQAWEIAQDALAQVRQLISTDTRKAQAAALTFAILVDKSGVLERGAAESGARQDRLDSGTAGRVMEMLRDVFGTLGCAVGVGDPLAQLLAHAARRAEGESDAPLPADMREAARLQLMRALTLTEPRGALDAGADQFTVDPDDVPEPDAEREADDVPEAEIVEPGAHEQPARRPMPIARPPQLSSPRLRKISGRW